jgi:hypothetical protein
VVSPRRASWVGFRVQSLGRVETSLRAGGDIPSAGSPAVPAGVLRSLLEAPRAGSVHSIYRLLLSLSRAAITKTAETSARVDGSGTLATSPPVM